MKPFRSRAMIAAALSVIRGTGRRRAVAVEVPATDRQLGMPVQSGAPCPASNSGPVGLESIADPAAPYSLIGW